MFFFILEFHLYFPVYRVLFYVIFFNIRISVPGGQCENTCVKYKPGFPFFNYGSFIIHSSNGGHVTCCILKQGGRIFPVVYLEMGQYFLILRFIKKTSYSFFVHTRLISLIRVPTQF